MSTIPEIQGGLRKATEELTARILELTRELSEIQVQQQEAAGGAPDFARLSREGGRRPIGALEGAGPENLSRHMLPPENVRRFVYG